MKNFLKSSLLPLVILCLLAFVAKNQIEQRGKLQARKALQLPPIAATYHSISLKRYSFGFNNLIGALIWVRLLQIAEYEPLKTDKVSWEYAQLEALTTLDPNFTRAYQFGSVVLSVFRRDKLGAKLILEKWVKRYPIYWKANYFLGYHLYFEMDQYESASQYILKAAKMERAPAFLPALGIRVLSEAGGLAESLRLAVELWGGFENRDPETHKRLQQRIRALRFALQQQTWEKALEKYRQTFKRDPKRSEDLDDAANEFQREIAGIVDEGVETIAASTQLAELFQERFGFRYDPRARKIVPVKTREELGLDIVGIHRPKT